MDHNQNSETEKKSGNFDPNQTVERVIHDMNTYLISSLRSRIDYLTEELRQKESFSTTMTIAAIAFAFIAALELIFILKNF